MNLLEYYVTRDLRSVLIGLKKNLFREDSQGINGEMSDGLNYFECFSIEW